MKRHHLKREIIANQLANLIINRMGTTFVFRLQEESSFSAADIARAFWIASRVFDAESLWTRIEQPGQPGVCRPAGRNDGDGAYPGRARGALGTAQPPQLPVRWTPVIAQYAAKVQALLAKLPQLVSAEAYPPGSASGKTPERSRTYRPIWPACWRVWSLPYR